MRDDDDIVGVPEKKLYEVLHEHLPQHRGEKRPDTIDIRKIGKGVGVSFQSVQRWIQADEVPSRRVDALVNLPGSNLTKEILLRFVSFS